MKTNLSIIQLLFTACIVFSCSEMKENEDFSADLISVDTKAVKDSPAFSVYDYCNKDGFWRQFNSLEERIEATQIPTDRLKDYSTFDLLTICISNPLTSIFTAYNNELQAVDILSDRLFSFIAFENRKDAADILLDFYSRVKITPHQIEPCTIEGNSISLSNLSCSFLELYILSSRIPGIFDSANIDRLLSSAEALYNHKRNNPELYSWFSWEKELLIRNLALSGNPFTKDKAHELYFNYHIRPAAETKSNFNDYVNNSDFWRRSINVYTLNNNPVHAQINRELTPNERIDIEQEFLSTFPGGMLQGDELETITSKYNCHAYAWHIVDNGPNTVTCWINRSFNDQFSEENLAQYWADGEYYHRVYEADAEKIYYSIADHSAIQSEDSGYYVSKWGKGPLMKHTPTNCPYLTDGIRYYSHTGTVYQEGNNDGNEDEGGDNGGHEGEGEGEGPVIRPPSLMITGSTNIRVNQSYSYSLRNMFDADEIYWSCLPISEGSNDVLISPSTGANITITVYSPGTYQLCVSYFGSESISQFGTLTITASY